MLSDLPLRRRVATACYVINAAVSIGLGSTYLFRESFMPYHADALGRSWAEVGPSLQVLLNALMEVAGAGWICLGLTILALVAVPFRRAEPWARVLLPVLLLMFYVPTLLATLSVLQHTPASPPWYGNAMACLTTLGGALADAPWRRPVRQGNHEH